MPKIVLPPRHLWIYRTGDDDDDDDGDYIFLTSYVICRNAPEILIWFDRVLNSLTW